MSQLETDDIEPMIIKDETYFIKKVDELIECLNKNLRTNVCNDSYLNLFKTSIEFFNIESDLAMKHANIQVMILNTNLIILNILNIVLIFVLIDFQKSLIYKMVSINKKLKIN